MTIIYRYSVSTNKSRQNLSIINEDRNIESFFVAAVAALQLAAKVKCGNNYRTNGTQKKIKNKSEEVMHLQVCVSNANKLPF